MALGRRSGLTRKQVELLAVLYSLSKDKGYCYAAKDTLSKWLYISKPDIYGQLSALEEYGLIKRDGKKIYLNCKTLEKFGMSLPHSKELNEEEAKDYFILIQYWMLSFTNIQKDDYKEYCKDIPAEEDDSEEWIDNIVKKITENNREEQILQRLIKLKGSKN